MGERERVAMLRRVLGGAGDGVRVPLGDDAAVIDAAGPVVVSVDAVIEHVHFRRAWLSFEDLGFKATMAALSDLAAMGAHPIGVVAALGLPPDVDDAALEALARGQRQACDDAGTVVVGGNLARASELSITTTVLGAATRSLERGGARPGDDVVVAGALGLARAGLLALTEGRPEYRALGPAIAAWRRPRAELARGLALAPFATAAIDVSDGLGLDLDRLAEASGVHVVVEGEALVVPPLAEAAAALDLDPLALALTGGEDYALVATLPAGVVVPGTRRIGRCEAPPGGSTPSRVSLERDGTRTPIPASGFDHFTSGRP